MNAELIIRRIRQRANGFRSMTNPSAPIGIVSGRCVPHAKARVTKADPANGRPAEVTCYANTAYVDLEREVVVPTGGDMQSYMGLNKALFVDHRYDVLSAVATCRKMTLDPSGWLCTGQFLQGIESPYVKACIALAMAGTLAMSVGFEALDWGDPTREEAAAYPGVESVVRRWKALEVSYTAMPMNVTCRLVSHNIAGDATEKARKALIDAHIDAEVVAHFGIKPRRVIVLT